MEQELNLLNFSSFDQALRSPLSVIFDGARVFVCRTAKIKSILNLRSKLQQMNGREK